MTSLLAGFRIRLFLSLYKWRHVRPAIASVKLKASASELRSIGTDWGDLIDRDISLTGGDKLICLVRLGIEMYWGPKSPEHERP